MGTRSRRLPEDLGAICLKNGRVRFCVWAPRCHTVEVDIWGPGSRILRLRPAPDGYFVGVTRGKAGLRYFYRLDGERRRPDPASRALPDGVHGPSEVADTGAFAWTDAGWRGMALRDMVIYELHVGSFTPEGTFEAVIPRLARLKELGVTAIELMPVASFPGSRNWGYDGVGLFAPQRTYGGPLGLQRLVDACHAHGLAVVLDVVYNHLGPEGNYLAEFGPYFTHRYKTPWGPAVNYDGEDARGVRDFMLANALYWIREYHVDGLRLDAIHGIFDESPVHILRELNDTVQRYARRLGRIVPIVAESDLNDRRVIDPVRQGGYGLAGQWNDDFHHCLHTLLTGERNGYYADFGSLKQLAKAYTDAFVYEGQFSVFRGRPHGTPTRDISPDRFVVCAQNHDQVGNRAQGERLYSLVEFERLKLAASAVLLSPYVPLLFMGEEYGERAPFLFFTDFMDPALQATVSQGRREEFAAFGWSGEVPDPQDPLSFARAKLTWNIQTQEPHRWLWEYYRALLALRRRHPVLGTAQTRRLEARELDEGTLAVFRRGPNRAAAFFVLNFAAEGQTVRLRVPRGPWRRLLDSAEERFGGLGARSPVLLQPSPGGWGEIPLGDHGVVVYLREPTALPASGQAGTGTAAAKGEDLLGVRQEAGTRGAG